MKCCKCGTDKNVHFRESMEYLCDNCLYKELEDKEICKESQQDDIKYECEKDKRIFEGVEE